MMQGQNTWYVGNLVRVPVYVDAGAAFTLLWIAWVVNGDLRRIILAIVAFMATIVLHELGHALTARARGMGGIHIVLSALGGYCSYHGRENPKAGLMISLAGPAVNFLLVVLLWGLFSVMAANYLEAGISNATWWNVFVSANHRSLPNMGEFTGMLCELAAFGLMVNFFLGILNIMPVYPMDGGQALYRFLQIYVNDARARRATLSVSVGGAIGCVALFSWFSGGLDTFILMLMLFLLYQAWRMLA